ncbi:MAG: HAD family hydrolase [Dictyoglomi bacterium]|nr:HAD family hydrolase [Dictyoglomota bacterium]
MLLLFDMFGTLVDITPVNKRIYEFFKVYSNKDIDYQSFHDFYIEKYYEVFSNLDKRPYMVERYYFNRLYSELLNYLGVSKSPDFVVGYVYGLLSSIPPFDDIECVNKLKVEGHTIWILSNSDSEYSLPLTKSLPIEVDGITTAAMAKAYKPHKDIYLKALTDSGFEPKNAIMIGDSLSDVIGADRVGIKGILIDRYGKYKDYEGVKVSSLCEVKEVLHRVV